MSGGNISRAAPAKPSAGPRIPSSLGLASGRTAANEDDLHRLRTAAWHRQGVVSVRVDDIRDDWLRQALINLGNETYGHRAPAAAK